jgi:radical SAM protein with 4Fe4S-binding SPASM domain
MSTRAASGEAYLALAPHCALKRLEVPTLYDIREDQAYELDEEAFAYLASGPPRAAAAASPESAALLDFCRGEGLLVAVPAPAPVAVPAAPACTPTLRYLLVHVTDRCNLACRHCFVGAPRGRELPLGDVLRLAEEFEALQGLRFIVSGGEPLRHRAFWELNERLPAFRFRSILLSNGTLVDPPTARALRFHEVQVSLDGLEESHDRLRGPGSFARAFRGLANLVDAGVAVSVSSVAHAGNLDDFDRLARLLEDLPLRGWSVDVPCPAGTLRENLDLLPDPARAARVMGHSFGGGFYGSGGNYACGAHLAAVMADGTICKCGYYADRPAGRLPEPLAAAWGRLPRVTLDQLSCRCSHLASCRGGCRYRAQAHGCALGPDPVMCLSRGVPPGGDLPQNC